MIICCMWTKRSYVQRLLRCSLLNGEISKQYICNSVEIEKSLNPAWRQSCGQGTKVFIKVTFHSCRSGRQSRRDLRVPVGLQVVGHIVGQWSRRRRVLLYPLCAHTVKHTLMCVLALKVYLMLHVEQTHTHAHTKLTAGLKPRVTTGCKVASDLQSSF